MTRAARLLVVLVLAAAGLVLTACQGTATLTNGPVGNETVTWGPPWNVTPSSTRRVSRTTSTAPCSGTVTTDEVDECEGDACKVTPAPRPAAPR